MFECLWVLAVWFGVDYIAFDLVGFVKLIVLVVVSCFTVVGGA